MEGNDGDRCKDNYSSSSVEMDVYESNLQENEETFSHGEATFHLFPSPSPFLLWMVKFMCLGWIFTSL
jgi:hypothetical protein